MVVVSAVLEATRPVEPGEVGESRVPGDPGPVLASVERLRSWPLLGPLVAGLLRLPLVKLTRSMLVSLGTTGLSLSILVVLTRFDLLPAGQANVVATLAGVFPSYYGNRRWAWGRSGRHDLRREVLPFWVLCVTALVVSTVAVSAAASWADAAGLGATARTAVVVAANLTTFGSLWVAQFLLLDRVLFARSERPR